MTCCPPRFVWNVEVERESDGRWLADVPELPGVMAYAESEAGARRAALILALRVVADRLEHGEPVPAALLGAFGIAA